MGDIENGKCQICGAEGQINRKYYHYGIRCECHSPQHFEIVFHCNSCEPVEPKQTTVTIKTENLLKEAISLLCEELAADKSEGSYYYSWQSNIAMAFIDECNNWRERTGRETIPASAFHEIANNAAKNFLDLLTSQPKK